MKDNNLALLSNKRYSHLSSHQTQQDPTKFYFLMKSSALKNDDDRNSATYRQFSKTARHFFDIEKAKSHQRPQK